MTAAEEAKVMELLDVVRDQAVEVVREEKRKDAEHCKAIYDIAQSTQAELLDVFTWACRLEVLLFRALDRIEELEGGAE